MQREEHPGTVAADAVSGPGTAMGDRCEPREGALDELARRPPARVGSWSAVVTAGCSCLSSVVKERWRLPSDVALAGGDGKEVAG
jgi:hypothetical protein